MSCSISSEHLNNPLLKELLYKLTDFFQSVSLDFFIIGATARDIILSGIYNQASARRSIDLDIAIAIKEWEKFNQIAEGLCQIKEFTKDPFQKQRFKYKNLYSVDIVPFGEIARSDKSIYWPPEEEFAMSVVGFAEVAEKTLEVKIDNEFLVKVASLSGIFILKLAAFNDRKNQTNKDADDMAFIIENYLEINLERAVQSHYDIYEVENFDTFIAGASLLGRDLNSILIGNELTINSFIQILEEELSLGDSSLLLNQIVETHKHLFYDTVMQAFKNILKELTQ